MNDPGGVDESDDWTSDDWRWRTDEDEEALFFWGRPFLPPPPRPSYLEDTDSLVLPDGLTTCDLCSWALGGPPHDPLIQVRGHGLSWTITLVIVSIISAVIGAIVMVTLLHCKRRVSPASGSHRSSKTRSFFCLGRRRRRSVPSSTASSRLNNEHKTLNNLGRHCPAHKATNVDVESRTSSSNNLCFVFAPCAKSVTSPHELRMTSLKKSSNHYTVEEGYQHPVYGEGEEPVYTELDKVSHTAGTPAYQNTGFLQCDIEHAEHTSSRFHACDTEHTSSRFHPCDTEHTSSRFHACDTEHTSSRFHACDTEHTGSRFHPCDTEHTASKFHPCDTEHASSRYLPCDTEHNSSRYIPCDTEHTSSAPSSAYYSDFSESNTRQYECIGDPGPPAPARNATKAPLSVINEALHNVPSDYI